MRLCQHADRYISMVWFSSTKNAFEVLIIHTLGTYRLIDSFPAVCLHCSEKFRFRAKKMWFRFYFSYALTLLAVYSADCISLWHFCCHHNPKRPTNRWAGCWICFFPMRAGLSGVFIPVLFKSSWAVGLIPMNKLHVTFCFPWFPWNLQPIVLEHYRTLDSCSFLSCTELLH